MSIFQKLTTDESIVEGKDSLGGFGPVDTDIYLTDVQAAYVTNAPSGAMALNVILKTEQGKDVTQQFWMTSGTDKGGKNYYEKDGKKHYLPGFEQANHLCLLTTGKEISELDTEEKVIKLYSAEAKGQVPTKVPMLVDLVGQKVYAAIEKQTVDKTAKDAAGTYVPTGETRDVNEVVRFFRERDKKTVAEIKGQVEEAEFFDAWQSKFKGTVRNKAKAAGQGKPGLPGTATPAANSKPQKSLFAAA